MPRLVGKKLIRGAGDRSGDSYEAAGVVPVLAD
jgi:hypothetical protein